jgi:excisionase family DNA binding protein
MDDKLLTTGQAAKMCSVTPDTVLKWIRSGRLPAVRTAGGHHRIAEQDVVGLFNPEQARVDEAGSEPEHFRYCWEFNGKGELLNGCKSCVVYRMRAKRCYEVVEHARQVGHKKLFCKQSCDECDYYQLVHLQSANVLVVTDNEVLADDLKRSAQDAGLNLEVTDCEYNVSSLVATFRPDYAILDCSLGKQFTQDMYTHLTHDPRIPLIRVILAAADGEFPTECDKDVFARIQKPFSVSDVTECIQGDDRKEAAS